MRRLLALGAVATLALAGSAAGKTDPGDELAGVTPADGKAGSSKCEIECGGFIRNPRAPCVK